MLISWKVHIGINQERACSLIKRLCLWISSCHSRLINQQYFLLYSCPMILRSGGELTASSSIATHSSLKVHWWRWLNKNESFNSWWTQDRRKLRTFFQTHIHSFPPTRYKRNILKTAMKDGHSAFSFVFIFLEVPSSNKKKIWTSSKPPDLIFS